MADGVARVYPGVRLIVTGIDQAMVRSASARLAVHEDVAVEHADVTALSRKPARR